MTDQIFIMLLLIHFLADFGLQTHEQAQGKSKEWPSLLYHTGVYSIMWLMGFFIIGGNWGLALIATAITFVAHTATDYVTSRLSSKYFATNDMHNGFVIIGFDQLLHMIQLWFTIKLILL